MMLYVDYIGSVPNPKYKYHGGSNYTKKIILYLLEHLEDRHSVCVIWPRWHRPGDELEEKIYHSKRCMIMQADEINKSIHVQENSVFFFPLLRTRRFPILEKVKQYWPSAKICLTNHDVRWIDIVPDKYDAFYAVKYSYALELAKYIVLKQLYSVCIKKYLKHADKIFTVSNDALQKLVRIIPVVNINYYYEMAFIETNPVQKRFYQEYILFVSGGRKEKNFARALEAFCRYKKETQNQMYLFVTGITSDILKRLCRNPKTDAELVKKWVKVFPYVDYRTLSDLYRQCRFLFYPSKNEGFGLPVLEAALYGKKAVASYVSSIPEVMGCFETYVNPYSVESMKNALVWMEKNCQPDAAFYEKIEMVKKEGEMDMKQFAKDLLDF
jgi:glycosyltransferase involved in cell wall biosynthesis